MRRVTDRELASIFSSLAMMPRCVVSGNFATPRELLRIFDGSVAAYRLHMLLAQPGIPDRPDVSYETTFVGAGMRDHPRLSYVPCRLSLVPHLYDHYCAPDVVLVHTSPPRDGKFSLGIEVNVLPAAIEAARRRGGVVVAQANPNMPYTFGDSELPEHLVDYVLEAEEPLTHPAVRGGNDGETAIASRIATVVPDGATLQVGIGAIPDAVLGSLVNHRGLGVWTEVFSDGVLRLHEAGALDPSRLLSASFLFGSRELYDWVDTNPLVRMRRTEVCNNPSTIAAQPMMTSINAALQVDLYDQANASRIGGRIYSGIGGSTDFLVGAMHSVGGQAFITLLSWHAKSGASTIVPRLSDPATHSQHTAVVTEHGMAQIFGSHQRAQALNIINHAADPRAREWLLQAAQEMRLV